MGDKFDVFISHSHADVDAAKRLADEWESWGLAVYADFKDPRLVRASRRNVMTAKLSNDLREAIRACRVFVYVVSEHSMASGWMPWELGLAHGAVGRVHLYFLGTASRETFAPREYLELYRSSSFDARNARAYLRRIVARARAEATTPIERDSAREWAERAMDALQAAQSDAIAREFSQHPAERAGAALAVSAEKLPETSTTFARPRR